MMILRQFLLFMAAKNSKKPCAAVTELKGLGLRSFGSIDLARGCFFLVGVLKARLKISVVV